MNARRWVLPLVAVAAQAQGVTENERLVQLSAVLVTGTGYTRAEKVRAINEISDMRTTSGLAAGMLFDRANIRFEEDEMVREAAALGLRNTCDLRNRMYALRLVRIADPAVEPSPRVRIAALKSLAAFQVGEAASRVAGATEASREPDATVRAAAKELVQKGLAADLY